MPFTRRVGSRANRVNLWRLAPSPRTVGQVTGAWFALPFHEMLLDPNVWWLPRLQSDPLVGSSWLSGPETGEGGQNPIVMF